MKNRLIIAGIVVAFSPLVVWMCLAEKDNTPQPGEPLYVVTLVDGTSLVCKPLIETLSVKTAYADLNLPLERIFSADFEKEKKQVTFKLANGDQIMGTVVLESLKVRTLMGETTIPRALIKDFYNANTIKDTSGSDDPGQNDLGQIEIEVQYVEYNLADIAAVTKNGMVNQDALIQLRNQGKGQLRYAPKVVTKTGQEATVKGVTEFIYPTDFTICAVEATNTSFAGTNRLGSELTNGLAVVEPSAFETREVGSVLQVTPMVDPSGTQIDVVLCPELTFEPEWKDYGFTYTDSTGRERKAHMEQPFFHSCRATTSVSLKDGGTILLGGGMPLRDGTKVLYAFLSARRIGIHGKPLRPR